jgi:hypothetical protein
LNWAWGPLPRYALELRGGDTCTRCAGEADSAPQTQGQPLLLQVRLDAQLSIELRPEQPSSGLLSVHAFLAHAGRIYRWPILMESTALGTLQLRGLCRDLLDLSASELGTYELLFVVQRSPLLTSFFDAQAQLERAPHDTAIQILRATIEVVAP